MCRPAAWKHVEHAVEIGGEHAAPLFSVRVDEGVTSAAANAGIGEAASTGRTAQRLPAIAIDGGASLTSQMRVRPCRTIGHARRAFLFFSALRAPDRDVAPGSASACAMPSPRPPLRR
jgi:hypothetical protein